MRIIAAAISASGSAVVGHRQLAPHVLLRSGAVVAAASTMASTTCTCTSRVGDQPALLFTKEPAHARPCTGGCVARAWHGMAWQSCSAKQRPVRCSCSPRLPSKGAAQDMMGGTRMHVCACAVGASPGCDRARARRSMCCCELRAYPKGHGGAGSASAAAADGARPPRPPAPPPAAPRPPHKMKQLLWLQPKGRMRSIIIAPQSFARNFRGILLPPPSSSAIMT